MAGVLVLVASVWILVNNGWLEGPVLLVLSPSHGVTVADLPSIAAIVLAGLLVLSSFSRPNDKYRAR